MVILVLFQKFPNSQIVQLTIILVFSLFGSPCITDRLIISSYLFRIYLPKCCGHSISICIHKYTQEQTTGETIVYATSTSSMWYPTAGVCRLRSRSRTIRLKQSQVIYSTVC